MTDDSSTTVNDSHKIKSPSAIELVDQTIREISGRDLVSSAEMTDMLLDIRLYLIAHSAEKVVLDH